jgi:hypothetical protein
MSVGQAVQKSLTKWPKFALKVQGGTLFIHTHFASFMDIIDYC